MFFCMHFASCLTKRSFSFPVDLVKPRIRRLKPNMLKCERAKRASVFQWSVVKNKRNSSYELTCFENIPYSAKSQQRAPNKAGRIKMVNLSYKLY